MMKDFCPEEQNIDNLHNISQKTSLVVENSIQELKSMESCCEILQDVDVEQVLISSLKI